MSKEEFVTMKIPKKDYDQMKKLAREAGYRSADDFAVAAIIQALVRAYGKDTKDLNAKELLAKYTEARTNNPCLGFPNFLDTIL